MIESGHILDAEARQKAEDRAAGVHRVGLSPAALKRKLKAKKDAARAKKTAPDEAKKVGNVRGH
jgi:hypothetical protein